MSDSLQAAAARFALLKQLKEHHEAMVKTLNGEIEKQGQELYKLFTDGDAEISGLRVAGTLFKDGKARLITPTVVLNPSVTVEKKPVFFAWLRANGYAELIKEDVHFQTLKSWVAQMKDNNKPLPDKSILGIYTIETASVKRAP